MNKITGNEPVNPIVGANGAPFFRGNEQDNNIVENGGYYFGLTVRQQFAMAAMPGIIAAMNPGVISKAQAEQIAVESVYCADALIAELNK